MDGGNELCRLIYEWFLFEHDWPIVLSLIELSSLARMMMHHWTAVAPAGTDKAAALTGMYS